MANYIIRKILEENDRRNAEVYAKFNPITGLGSIGERKKVCIEDFPIKKQYLPVEMMRVPLVRKLVEYGSIEKYLQEDPEMQASEEDFEEDREKVIKQFVKLRCR